MAFVPVNIVDGVTPINKTNLDLIQAGIVAASKRYSGLQTATNFSCSSTPILIVFSAAEYGGDATAANFEYNSTGIKGFLIPAGVSSANVSLNITINSSFEGTAVIQIRRYTGESYVIVGNQPITKIGGENIGSCSGNIPVAEGDTLQAYIITSTQTNATLITGTSFSCTAS